MRLECLRAVPGCRGDDDLALEPRIDARRCDHRERELGWDGSDVLPGDRQRDRFKALKNFCAGTINFVQSSAILCSFVPGAKNVQSRDRQESVTKATLAVDRAGVKY